MSKKKKLEPTKPKIDFKIEKLSVRHNFTDAEIAAKAREANRENALSCQLEAELGSYKKEMTGKIEAANMRHTVLLQKIGDGFEIHNNVDCYVMFNTAYDEVTKYGREEKGQKTIWLLGADNKPGAFVRQEPMTESDLQRDLPLPTDKPAEPKPGEPLNPVGEAFEAGKRKRGKQRVIEAEIVNDDRLLNAPADKDPQNAPPADKEEPPHIVAGPQ